MCFQLIEWEDECSLKSQLEVILCNKSQVFQGEFEHRFTWNGTQPHCVIGDKSFLFAELSIHRCSIISLKYTNVLRPVLDKLKTSLLNWALKNQNLNALKFNIFAGTK